MVTFGVSQFFGFWVVTLATDGNSHTPEIVEWIKHSFGTVDPGAMVTGVIEEYWFTNPEDATTTWLAWG
jgi:hypothetical protein